MSAGLGSSGHTSARSSDISTYSSASIFLTTFGGSAAAGLYGPGVCSDTVTSAVFLRRRMRVAVWYLSPSGDKSRDVWEVRRGRSSPILGPLGPAEIDGQLINTYVCMHAIAAIEACPGLPGTAATHAA